MANEAATTEILAVRGLEKAFSCPKPVHILRGVDITLFEGETLAIMGRSGEGKTTLLQILGTLEPPDRGSIRIAGLPVNTGNKSALRNRHIGFIFQSFHLLEHYSAIDNVLMPAQIARQSTQRGSAAYRRAEALLEQVGLKDRIHFHTALLSGGEKQRVAVARALINDPALILADEPTGNLDTETSEQLQDLLIHCIKTFKKALVVVTHDAELANCCDRRSFLRGGTLNSS